MAPSIAMEPGAKANGVVEQGPAVTPDLEEYTIVIVGGGPQGLAVLSALHEWYSFAELGMHRDSDYRFRMGKTKKFKKVNNHHHVHGWGIFAGEDGIRV